MPARSAPAGFRDGELVQRLGMVIALRTKVVRLKMFEGSAAAVRGWRTIAAMRFMSR